MIIMKNSKTDISPSIKFKAKSFTKATVFLSLAVAASVVLGGCGAKTASQTGENIVPIEQNSTDNTNIGDSEYVPKYDVKLDERSDSQKHDYAEDDLAFVDTLSGKKINLGMSQSDIEVITGDAVRNDGNYKVYDGVIVQYKDDKAVTLIVSGGEFKDSSAKRYKTTRGIGIGTTKDDFSKAYGDELNQGGVETAENGEEEKNPTLAKRYFKKDGSKIKFLGTELSDDQKKEKKESEKDGDGVEYYMQDFMFNDSDNTVITLRVSLQSAATGGI